MNRKRILEKIFLTITTIAMLSFAGLVILSPYMRVAILNGTSMWPTFNNGDAAFFTRTFNPENISTGSIISYQNSHFNFSICHRIINSSIDDQGLYYTLKGDNNPVVDPFPVRPVEIQGLLIYAQPGWLFFIEFILPWLITSGYALWRILTIIRNKIRKRHGETHG